MAAHVANVKCRWLTTGDMARELGVHVSTVWCWLRSGRLVADRRTLGGHARFTQESLDALRVSMTRAA
jgi:excisionase family DNA binding protein